MADKKISALDAATTPLAGTEVVALVQSGTTKKVPVSDLTAGRAISATQLTLTTGSLIVASGQGVDFSATPGTGTSELFDDYEEGTWTPTPTRSGGALSATFTSSGIYTKVGRMVTVHGQINITAIASQTGDYIVVSGLPFASVSPFAAWQIGGVITRNAACNGTVMTKVMPEGSTLWAGTDKSGDFPVDNALWSNGSLDFSVTYFTT